MSGIFKINLSSTSFSAPIINNKNKSVVIKSKNLTPLAADTVSFSGKNKAAGDVHADPNEFFVSTRNSKTLTSGELTISKSLSKMIHSEAQDDLLKIKNAIKGSLSSLVSDYGVVCDSKHPIYELEFRVKTPDSIREKASQKFLPTKEAVQKGIGDIIGARIILGDNSKESNEIVLDKLLDAVKDGKLKIIEVENHTPYDRKYQYHGEDKLHELAKASSGRYGVFVREKAIKNESGYTAVHMKVAFPDGYNGEIQIIGKDVATLKELEDIPYKILQGKQVKPQYYKIKEILSPMCISSGLENSDHGARIKLRNEFMEYTDAAYKYEREKPPVSKRKDDILPHFLSVPEFVQGKNERYHLTPSMDFNNLYRLKLSADKKAAQAKKI